MLVWPVIEAVLVITRRARRRDTQAAGGGAGMVWAVAVPSTVLAVVLGKLGVLPLPLDPIWSPILALAAVVAGLTIRLTALRTLGEFFSVDVRLQPEHELVTKGLYRFVRHPAYTGLLLCFLGVGFISWSWVGLFLTTVPIFLVLAYRISVEERALGRCFGQDYEDYCHRTRRLIPGIY